DLALNLLQYAILTQLGPWISDSVRLEHDPEKCEAVFREKSCANNNLKRDDDSSHRALVDFSQLTGRSSSGFDPVASAGQDAEVPLAHACAAA
ncbi:hypothetical protein, partial [Bradyrhizobium sp. UFLA05-112]